MVRMEQEQRGGWRAHALRKHLSPRNAGPMNTNDEPKTLGPGRDHVSLKARRSGDEKRAAEAKEIARHRARKTKGRRLKYLD